MRAEANLVARVIKDHQRWWFYDWDTSYRRALCTCDRWFSASPLTQGGIEEWRLHVADEVLKVLPGASPPPAAPSASPTYTDEEWLNYGGKQGG